MDNDSTQLFTAKHRLENAARYFSPGDAVKLDELQRAAVAYQNALADEERRVVTISLEEIGEEETTKEYPVGMELPL